MIRIETTRAIWIPWLSNFLRNSTIHSHVFIFGNMFHKSRFRCYADYKLYRIYTYLISDCSTSCSTCDRQSNETVTLRKHDTKYKHMWKWMVEFLKKFENRGIKIAEVNSIRNTKSINILFFCTVHGGPLWCWPFLTNCPCVVH